jgi:hypothetical protein
MRFVLKDAVATALVAPGGLLPSTSATPATSPTSKLILRFVLVSTDVGAKRVPRWFQTTTTTPGSTARCRSAMTGQRHFR